MLFLLFFFAFATASPLLVYPDDLPLLRRDGDAAAGTNRVCPDPSNYPWDKQKFDCQHIHHMNATGACMDDLAYNGDAKACGAYCEVRNYWRPGPEQPFGVSCSAKAPCMLSKGTSIGFSHSWGLSVELAIPGPGEFAKALSAFPLKWMMLGASYTYTQSTTYDTGQMYWRQTNTTDYCGYFTFVPYMITSCGSMTVSPSHQEILFWKHTCLKDQVKTYGNICTEWPMVKDGQALGEVVWVNTVCEGGGLLPMMYQTPIYRYPGVQNGSIIADWKPPNVTTTSGVAGATATDAQDPQFSLDPKTAPPKRKV